MYQSFEDDMRDNRTDAFIFIPEDYTPPGASAIGFHTVYKVKEDGNDLRLKFCSVLHFNSYKAIFAVLRDSASADLSVIHLLLSLGVILGFSFGTTDVK